MAARGLKRHAPPLGPPKRARKEAGCTDISIATAFAERHGSDFAHNGKTWYAFMDTRWVGGRAAEAFLQETLTGCCVEEYEAEQLAAVDAIQALEAKHDTDKIAALLHAADPFHPPQGLAKEVGSLYMRHKAASEAIRRLSEGPSRLRIQKDIAHLCLHEGFEEQLAADARQAGCDAVSSSGTPTTILFRWSRR